MLAYSGGSTRLSRAVVHIAMGDGSCPVAARPERS